jgi:hypothetical protein
MVITIQICMHDDFLNLYGGAKITSILTTRITVAQPQFLKDLNVAGLKATDRARPLLIQYTSILRIEPY